MSNYSVLFSHQAISLPYALARDMANTPLGSERMPMLNRIFEGMAPEQKEECRQYLNTRRQFEGGRMFL